MVVDGVAVCVLELRVDSVSHDQRKVVVVLGGSVVSNEMRLSVVWVAPSPGLRVVTVVAALRGQMVSSMFWGNKKSEEDCVRGLCRGQCEIK